MSDPVLGEPIPHVTGTGLFVSGDDIDTDRIIPARYMKVVTFDGLGAHAFHDERFTADGATKGHPFDDPRFEGASVLVSGRNFGCGSSREHAPQALFRYGVRAIVAGSFAEIFFGNCTTLGIVCVTVSDAARAEMADAIQQDPTVPITIDVERGVVRCGASSYSASLPESARDALLSGRWDPLQTLRARHDRIEEVAKGLPYAAWAGLTG